jgi:hypothetical protein
MASPRLEKMQRISPLVPVNDESNLRRKDRFDKSARKNIYRNCLLPVLSCSLRGSIRIPCYRIRLKISEAANAVHTATMVSRPPLIYWLVGC